MEIADQLDTDYRAPLASAARSKAGAIGCWETGSDVLHSGNKERHPVDLAVIMKIVVTGGCGKAGRFIVRELTCGNGGGAIHHVVVFDRTMGTGIDRIRYLAGDVLDQDQVFKAVDGSDAVIHLAGIPGYGAAPDDVTLRTNVMGAFHVHNAAWQLGVNRVVTVSSEAVLGWAPGAWTREHVPDYLPMDESHPLLPQDAYGLSKKTVEAIACSFSAKSDLTTVLLRPPRIVVPEELLVFRKSEGIVPDRFALFNYIDARDLAVACRLAVERPMAGHHILFLGSGDSLAREPLCSLYPRLLPSMGDKARALTGASPSVSIEKARRVLGWSPQYSWRRSNHEIE